MPTTPKAADFYRIVRPMSQSGLICTGVVVDSPTPSRLARAYAIGTTIYYLVPLAPKVLRGGLIALHQDAIFAYEG